MRLLRIRGAPLTRRRLEWLVRARGTTLVTWPEADRVAALELLRRSPEAQEWFAEALSREEEVAETDCAVFNRMQAALRRRLAPLPMALRGLALGALVACMAAGLYLAVDQTEPESGTDLFNSAQTVTFAALDQ